MKEATSLSIQSFIDSIYEEVRLGNSPKVELFKDRHGYTVTFRSEKVATQTLNLSGPELELFKSLAWKSGVSLRS